MRRVLAFAAALHLGCVDEAGPSFLDAEGSGVDAAGSGTDAAGSGTDAAVYSECGSTLDAGYLFLAPGPDGQCVSCAGGFMNEGDDECQAYATAIGPGCQAFCPAPGTACEQTCPGACFGPDGPGGGTGCVPGGDQCAGQPVGSYLCDPTCGTSGGCKPCAFDDQCRDEFGPQAYCMRHCGTCCKSGVSFECECI